MSASRHLRTGSGLSWFSLILGTLLGITIGLIYTWEIDPVIERNTSPWQLGPQAREDYVVAVALSYTHNQDLPLAFNRLRGLRPDGNVWQMVADVACDRLTQGKTVTNSDVQVIRALEQLYEPQGASGCADDQYPTPAPITFVAPTPADTPTPTLTPYPTKTGTVPPLTSTPNVAPAVTTIPPAGRFVVGQVRSFCDPQASGTLEVRVYDRRGEGIPGVHVQVMWSGNQSDSFFTGLKPDREPGYADFEMTAGRTYTISVPGLVGAPPDVEAVPCEFEDGDRTITTTTSYFVNFQQQPD